MKTIVDVPIKPMSLARTIAVILTGACIVIGVMYMGLAYLLNQYITHLDQTVVSRAAAPSVEERQLKEEFKRRTDRLRQLGLID